MKIKFLILSLCATTRAFRKADCFFFLFRGREQGTAEHRLVAVFKCLSEHALSHASLAGHAFFLTQ